MASEDRSTSAALADTRPAEAVDATAPATPVEPKVSGAMRTPTLTPTPISTLIDREARANLRRQLLQGVAILLAVWGIFALIDLVTQAAEHDPAWLETTGTRVAFTVFAGACALALWRVSDASHRVLRTFEIAIVFACMVATTVICALHGGWESPRLARAGLVLMGHAIICSNHWKKMLLPVVVMCLSVPGTLIVCSLDSDALEEQMTDPRAMQTFFDHYRAVLGAAAVSLVAGHFVAGLRAQVAASKSLGRYRLKERIARGGMGEVWSAYHEALRRDVAIKLIHPQLGSDPVVIERFEREVRTLAELTHPNVVRVFDYGATEAGVCYYTMELLDAESLMQVLGKEGPMPLSRALRLVTQTAQALAEAHERGIVHRDIKPGNLLVVSRGGSTEFVKLIDFGIAKQDQQGEDLTKTGMLVGTPGYIAPEVVTGGTATARSDVYALGMVLYETLAGRLPFEDPARLRAPLTMVPPRSIPGREDVPDALMRVIARCLAREPASRFANAGELAAALLAIDAHA